MTRAPFAKLVIAALLVLVATGCPGDDVLIVKGEIPAISELCRLDLFLVNYDESVAWQHVQGDFRRDFTVSTRAARYYLVLTCPGYRPLTSKIFDVGKDANLTEIDLGRMEPEKLQD